VTRTTRIPLAEFARREGKSYQTIREKVARGSIKGEKVKGTWFVIVEDSIQVEDPQNPQRPDLKAPDKPLGDMIFQALSYLKDMESTRSVEVGRLQDQLAQFHRDRLEEVKRLQDQIQALHQDRKEEVGRLNIQIQSDRRSLSVLFILAGSMLGTLTFLGWMIHQSMMTGQRAEQSHAIETIHASHAQNRKDLKDEVERLRRELTDEQNRAENLRRDQSTLDGLKATMGANLIRGGEIYTSGNQILD